MMITGGQIIRLCLITFCSVGNITSFRMIDNTMMMMTTICSDLKPAVGSDVKSISTKSTVPDLKSTTTGRIRFKKEDLKQTTVVRSISSDLKPAIVSDVTSISTKSTTPVPDVKSTTGRITSTPEDLKQTTVVKSTIDVKTASSDVVKRTAAAMINNDEIQAQQLFASYMNNSLRNLANQLIRGGKPLQGLCAADRSNDRLVLCGKLYGRHFDRKTKTGGDDEIFITQLLENNTQIYVAISNCKLYTVFAPAELDLHPDDVKNVQIVFEYYAFHCIRYRGTPERDRKLVIMSEGVKSGATAFIYRRLNELKDDVLEVKHHLTLNANAYDKVTKSRLVYT